MPATPSLISVILVCRNPGPRLAAALESVWSQTHSSELIVIDGASTDGSSEWLEANRHRLTYFSSAPDHGIYDAMNKGVTAATGEWLLFLGADDCLASPHTFSCAATALANTSASIISGEARFDDGRLYSFTDTHAAIRRNFVHHQATFYRRDLFVRHGGFDLSLRIQADYEFNLRMLKSGESFAPMGQRIAECSSGGVSDSGSWQNYREEIVARHRYFSAWRSWPWDAAAILRYTRKRLLRSRPK